ncbi:50S ribosomal protein L24 [Candidatus Woesebacteria bacterium]|nr:50S ribosomal protein L24 [Candidatus Woesebacteria bacterium]
MKFKVGDTVKITAGKDKGRDGKIEILFAKEALALIPGINIYKKHAKGQTGQKGGIYELPRPLAFGKIALVCPKCKKVTRVGFRVRQNEKVRVCAKCKKEIDSK